MQEIKTLAKYIREELGDAEKYAKQALACKAKDRQLADLYCTLSRQELGHADMEHDQAVRLIREAESAGKAAPESMAAIWDWEHEQMAERKAEVLVLLDMYKNG